MAANDSFFKEFSDFQTAFFTNKERFANKDRYDVKRFGFILVNNIAKGYPNLADNLFSIRGINWEASTSHSILRALQTKFVNRYQQRPRVPSFIYFKNMKPPKEKKVRKKVETKKGLEFDEVTQSEIQSILMYDSKTFEALKYSDKVQFLGKQIVETHLKKSFKKTVVKQVK